VLASQASVQVWAAAALRRYPLLRWKPGDGQDALVEVVARTNPTVKTPSEEPCPREVDVDRATDLAVSGGPSDWGFPIVFEPSDG